MTPSKSNASFNETPRARDADRAEERLVGRATLLRLGRVPMLNFPVQLGVSEDDAGRDEPRIERSNVRARILWLFRGTLRAIVHIGYWKRPRGLVSKTHKNATRDAGKPPRRLQSRVGVRQHRRALPRPLRTRPDAQSDTSRAKRRNTRLLNSVSKPNTQREEISRRAQRRASSPQLRKGQRDRSRHTHTRGSAAAARARKRTHDDEAPCLVWKKIKLARVFSRRARRKKRVRNVSRKTPFFLFLENIRGAQFLYVAARALVARRLGALELLVGSGPCRTPRQFVAHLLHAHLAPERLDLAGRPVRQGRAQERTSF